MSVSARRKTQKDRDMMAGNISGVAFLVMLVVLGLWYLFVFVG